MTNYLLHYLIIILIAAMCDLPRLMKFGVGIMEDRRKLFQRTFVLPVSCVDLRNVAKLFGFTGSLSLATLAKKLTGAELDKDSAVRRGDWEAEVLSPAQASIAVDVHQ